MSRSGDKSGGGGHGVISDSWGQIPTQCQSNEQVFRSDFINYNENVTLTNLNDDVIGFYIANVHTVTMATH